MNRITLIGNVTQEIKYFGQASNVAKVNLATNRNYKNDAGEWKSDVTYHSITAFGKLAEKLLNAAIGKGDRLMIEGSIKNEKYEKDGKEIKLNVVHAQSIEFIEKPSKGEFKPVEPAKPDGVDWSDDDIPF